MATMLSKSFFIRSQCHPWGAHDGMWGMCYASQAKVLGTHYEIDGCKAFLSHLCFIPKFHSIKAECNL